MEVPESVRVASDGGCWGRLQARPWEVPLEEPAPPVAVRLDTSTAVASCSFFYELKI